MINRDELANFLAQTLNISSVRDYCPNGLQVEGRGVIQTLASGVTASLALIEAAVEAKADALLVHHGFFWRGEDPRLVGPKHKRIKRLLQNDISLFAYHLPLDLHPALGNNAQLALRLDLLPESRFGEDGLGWLGSVNNASLRTVGDLAGLIADRLGREPLLIGDPGQPLGRVGWCTGAAQNLLQDAVAAGATVYLSGEISEQTVHLALETGTAYLACGHHATERFGVHALGEHIAAQFGIEHRFIDISNPV